MKGYVWKPSKIDWVSFDFRDFWVSSSDIHCLTDQWTTQWRITVLNLLQVLTSHFYEVNDLLDEHWAKIVLQEKLENIATPI